MFICCPVKSKNPEKFLKEIKAAQKEADIVEIWFDEWGKNLNKEILKEIFAVKKKPFIYKSTGNIKNIKMVLQNKIEFVDLDIKTDSSIIKNVKKISPKTKIILSFHDFKATPKTKILKKTAKNIIEKGANIIKLATHAKTSADSLRMLGLLDNLTQDGYKAICLCMGEKGKMTRTVGHLMGNYLMYAPLNSSSKTASGQINIDVLKKILKLTK